MAVLIPTAAFSDVTLIEDSDRIQGRQSGDSVAIGQLENANKQALELMNNIQALRQGTLKGAMNSLLSGAYSSAGAQTFASFASRTLTITGAGTPMVLNFADGFSAFGRKSQTVYFTGSLNIDYTASTTGYTYMVFAVYSGGNISLESIRVDVDVISALQYSAGPTAPALLTPDAPQYWFDSNGFKMKKQVSGAFVNAYAIFLGGVEITSGSGTFTPVPYGTPVWEQGNPAGALIHWHDIVNVNQGWMEADGSTLNIADYPILYGAFADLYGGLGTTFDLPTITAHAHGGVTLRYLVKLY